MTDYQHTITYLWRDDEARYPEGNTYRRLVNQLLAMQAWPLAEWLLAQGEDWRPKP